MPKKNENRRTNDTGPDSKNSIAELMRHMDCVLKEAERVKGMLAHFEADLVREGFHPRRKKRDEL